MAEFLGHYTLLDQIGKGGYAQICKVRHNKYRYIRAVKILAQHILKGEADEDWIKFRQECETLLRIGNGNHPNIIHIYQPMLVGMQAFVEMDYIDGKNIAHLVKEQPYTDTGEVLTLAADISSALAYCHVDIYKFCMDKNEDNLEDDPRDGSKPLLDPPTIERLIHKYRVTHNDVHSGNIMRRDSGGYVLLDFGLSVHDGEVLKTSKHKNGAIEYKAPEKWLDRRDSDTITPATDIYSFGVVLYEYLTGRLPFPADPRLEPHVAAHAVGEAHKNSPVPEIFPLRKAAYEKTHPGSTLDAPDYPLWLEEMIMRCLEKDPARRFANGKELNDYVTAHLNDDSDRQRIIALEAEKDAMAATNTALEADKKALAAANAALEADKKALANANSMLVADNRALAGEKATLEANNASLVANNASLARTNADLSKRTKSGGTAPLTPSRHGKGWKMTAIFLGAVALLCLGWVVYLMLSDNQGAGGQTTKDTPGQDTSMQTYIVPGATPGDPDTVYMTQTVYLHDTVYNDIYNERVVENPADANLQAENERLKREISEKDNTITARDNTIKQKDNEIKKLNDDNSAKDSRIRSLNAENSRLLKEIDRLRELVEQLHNK